MSKNISSLFILALILVSISAQTQCPQNNVRDLIQTGLIQFENTKQRQACKQVDIKYVIPNGKLQVIAAVISLENYKLVTGIDFSIKVAPKANISKFAATLLSDHTANWTKVKVSYLATSRTDMLLGNFLTDSFQTLKCLENTQTEKNIAQVSHVVPGWTKDFVSAKPVIFLSGVKALSLSLPSLKITSAELNASGILNIQIQSARGLQLQFVQLSYVLINSSFPFQYGFGLNITDYSFTAFSQIANNSLALQKWGIFTGSLICEGTQCPKTCLSKEECVKVTGNQLNGRCVVCEKGTIWNVSKCVTACGQNEIWNGQICVCDPKAVRVNTSCVLCIANSSPDQNQKQCVCNNGFVFNSFLSSCIAFTCPQNALPQPNEKGYTCACKPGFYPAGNVCQVIPQCPVNSTFNITTQKCVCTIAGQFIFNNTCVSCGTNQQFDQSTQKCVCKPNFFVSAGACVACPEFSTLNQDKTRCVCNEGYIFSEFKSACIAFKCPANALPNVTEAGVKCNCNTGFYVNGQNCDVIPSCPTGAVFDATQKACVCEKKTAIIVNGQCLECPPNSSWNGNSCVCNAGFAVVNGTCAISCGKNEVLENNTCICNLKSISINKTCQQCPLNASPNKDKTQCLCDTGFKWDDTTKACTKIVCPQNSVLKIVNETATCVCVEGFTPQGTTCLRVVKCPTNSVWSQDKLTCVCSLQGEYLINNECKKIGVNQEWNQINRVFVCKKGFNLINGECKVCDMTEYFDGVGCACKLGFYRNGLKCEACHSSCGTCSGPNANQCLNCSDVTLTFKNGSCTKEKACPRGLYQNGASCLPCSTYCSDCTSDCMCNSCINGFQLQSLTYGNISASYCVEKCGDGKRFELQCDDGNNKDGDGCSADCRIEQGWSCSGGSSTSASLCMLGNPDRTYLQLTGTVHLYGRIVQGVRLSYIPEALAANGCAECHNLLWVRVIRSDIVPGVRINFLPASRFQFLVELEFHGTFSIPSFTIAVQINPQYAKYFNMKDMAQIQIKTIDPALLARRDTQDQLSLDDIDQKKPIQVTKSVVNEIFKL